jgi:phosphoglycerate dehydrogenase-like enzyme
LVGAHWTGRQSILRRDLIIGQHLGQAKERRVPNRMNRFRVGITDDFVSGSVLGPWMDAAIDSLWANLPSLEWEFLPKGLDVMPAGAIRSYDAVVSGKPRWNRESFRDQDRLALVAYYGIGVDGIDLTAATEAGIAVTNSPSVATQQSLAEGALMLVLALAKQVVTRNELVRGGDAAKAQNLLGGLVADRVVGTIGLGATGRLFAKLVAPFAPRAILSYDPYVSRAEAAAVGAELAALERVVEESDYLVIMCRLTEQTRGLLSAELIARLKPTAYVVNCTRGAVIEQAALVASLKARRIAGAGLDVTEPEPLASSDPLLQCSNAIVTGHSVAWTEESLRGTCELPCAAVRKVYHGQIPDHIVNPRALEASFFKEKLQRSSRRTTGEWFS